MDMINEFKKMFIIEHSENNYDECRIINDDNTTIETIGIEKNEDEFIDENCELRKQPIQGNNAIKHESINEETIMESKLTHLNKAQRPQLKGMVRPESDSSKYVNSALFHNEDYNEEKPTSNVLNNKETYTTDDRITAEGEHSLPSLLDGLKRIDNVDEKETWNESKKADEFKKDFNSTLHNIKDSIEDTNSIQSLSSNNISSFGTLNNSKIEYIGKTKEIAFFGFSMQGTSHIKKGIKCQDKCRIKVSGINDSVIIAAIADGLGSCDYSDEGANTAVNAAVEYIDKFVLSKENLSGNILIDTIKESMNYAYERVEILAKEEDRDSFLYCSTLTVVVYYCNVTYIGHAGDDGVVLINDSGNCGLVTARHKGDEISSVFPLQSKDTWEFLKVKDIVGIIMATDGVLDAFVRNKNDNNQVFIPLIEPITDIEKFDDLIRVCQAYYAFMESSNFRTVVKDDITFLAIINMQGMKETEIPEFDLSKWIYNNKKRNIDIYKALYPDQELSSNIIESWTDTDMYLLDSLQMFINEDNLLPNAMEDIDNV